MKRNAIATYLRDAKLTQAQFARLIGVTPAAVSHFCTGRKKPAADTAVLIERKTQGQLTRAAVRPDLFT